MFKKNKSRNGWEIHEVFEPENHTRYNRYFFKRKRAPRIELNGNIAKQLAGYSLIEKDLRNVLIWLDEIEKLHPTSMRGETKISPDRNIYNLVKGLYVAVLTFYGKCFTKCEGRRIKLDKKLIDEDYKKVHDDVMHMRHNFAAHSGADSFEEVKIVLVLPPNKKSDEKPAIFRELMQPDFTENQDVSLKKLVLHVHAKVLAKIEEVEEKVYDLEIRVKGKEYWYQTAKRKRLS
ncbi:hypothetical protein J3369_09905 [Alteromonas sp. NFXS44]|uniref:hypothetical protein n=1 Tax=Alteromonas sp. NFXS44 TaxID=2818435 RepID=UPI0032DFA676